MPHRMELTIPSDPRWLRMVRAMMEEVSRQAGFDEKEGCEVVIAVDEALSNVMKHSYKGDPNKLVSLSCITEDGSLEVVLRDQGEVLDLERCEPKAPDEMRVGGRGIFLMRCTMDEVEYQRDGDTNLIRLRKHSKAKAR